MRLIDITHGNVYCVHISFLPTLQAKLQQGLTNCQKKKTKNREEMVLELVYALISFLHMYECVRSNQSLKSVRIISRVPI